MPVKEGDFLLVNYTLKVKESGETVDTTLDSVAKEARIHREDNVYQPKFVVIGEAFLPKSLEESLVGTDTGTKKTIELTPEKGYGLRDPGKMRLVSLRRFREKGIDPVPGRQVELEEGRPIVIRSVGAGRVQVDYNHPLAGRTLVYDISIEKVMEDRDDKILSLVSRRIPEVTSDKFKISHDDRDLTIEIPEEAFYLKGLQVAKNSITADLQKYFPRLNTIAFQEVYKRGTPEAKGEVPEPAAETKAETKEAKPEPKTAARKAEPKKSTGRKSSSTTSKRRSQKSKTGTEEETE